LGNANTTKQRQETGRLGNLGTEALAYARARWSVFPIYEPNGAGGCSCSNPGCENIGKHPRTVHGLKDATTSERTIITWWTRWPLANIGSPTGTRIVLDPDGPEGEASLSALEARHGQLPATLTARTGDGRHLYFSSNGTQIRNSNSKLGPHLDVRGHGGYAILPPSVHKTGKVYEWIVRAKCAPLPGWLPDLLAEPAGPDPTQPGNDQKIPKGHRHAHLLTLAGVLRARRCDEGTITAALLAENAARCDPPKPEREIRELAHDVCERYPPGKRNPSSNVNAGGNGASAEGPGAAEDSPEHTEPTQWPEDPDPAAYYGLAGEVVNTLAPQTESARVALLVQTLQCFGSLIGRTAFFRAEAKQHFMNLFAVLVGVTSTGRKGSSWAQVFRLFRMVAGGSWAKECVTSGLSSGEGLIWEVHDPVLKLEAIREKGRVVGYQDVVAESDVEDKRRLVLEAEFASPLRMMERDGNILSVVLRQAFDGDDLRTLVKHSKARATGAHIAMVGHITRDELRRELTVTDMANGFANRILWVCVSRSQELPEGGTLPDLSGLAREFDERVKFARDVSEMRRVPAIRRAWANAYHELTTARPGLLGAITSRGAPLVMRLACLYALLDNKAQVEKPHLAAASALWDYCSASAKFIFGDALGDPVADAILSALRNSIDGLDRTSISALFERNKSAAEIARALGTLQEHGLARATTAPADGEGRPREVWRAVGPNK
jgi:hypothetical protein